MIPLVGVYSEKIIFQKDAFTPIFTAALIYERQGLEAT